MRGVRSAGGDLPNLCPREPARREVLRRVRHTLVIPGRRLADERKVITALFCDLVGFTAASDAADSEDVGAMLGVYFAMARREIESFGGVVEKFIGDAVVGVFGVPAAHEDDQSGPSERGCVSPRRRSSSRASAGSR